MDIGLLLLLLLALNSNTLYLLFQLCKYSFIYPFIHIFPSLLFSCLNQPEKMTSAGSRT